MNLPCDYNAIFKDRVIIIGGVGRSGTTILGKIIDSMHPVVYLMEPAILKYMPMVCKSPFVAGGFLGTIFEDYIAPAICKKYKTFRRFDVMDWIKANNPVFIIKSNELQPQLEDIVKLFDGVKYIEIIRNGINVVDSSLNERGWFKDDYQQIDFHIDGVPYYIFEGDRRLWPKWNPATRAACNWRTLLNYLQKETPILRYENLKNSFQAIVSELPGHVTVTNETFDLIASVHPEKQSGITMDDIEQPERSLFVYKMKELGYL